MKRRNRFEGKEEIECTKYDYTYVGWQKRNSKRSFQISELVAG